MLILLKFFIFNRLVEIISLCDNFISFNIYQLRDVIYSKQSKIYVYILL
ncbi:hypothetical protein XBFFL1_2550059 [Xenorhabdus bovienii str. feltiae Florida]|nr:hypothetical protein XBFFR1_2130006 [Xenorhabdus bovienii str. feltiae France]CDG93539.1 hypothetical protein XBFFL1_2550059 [Xenorhabdus bovienii str. feltiae Florida]